MNYQEFQKSFKEAVPHPADQGFPAFWEACLQAPLSTPEWELRAVALIFEALRPISEALQIWEGDLYTELLKELQGMITGLRLKDEGLSKSFYQRLYNLHPSNSISGAESLGDGPVYYWEGKIYPSGPQDA